MIYRRDRRAYARVDFSWEDAGIVVEVSGRKGHSSPAERARGAQRRNELQDAGRRVRVHVGGRHDEIGDGHPHDARALRLRPPSSRRLTVLVQQPVSAFSGDATCFR
ncbi:MAG: hypothetical protein WKF58_09005 [Ilumatobacteraceae bacterium]